MILDSGHRKSIWSQHALASSFSYFIFGIFRLINFSFTHVSCLLLVAYVCFILLSSPRRNSALLAFSTAFYYTFYCFITVKFLREVTPYFRKASIISEVGWELQRAFLCPLSTASSMINPNGSNMMSTSSKTMSPPSAPAPKSPPRADTRYIPLQLTHLARNLKYHDPGMYVATYFYNTSTSFPMWKPFIIIFRRVIQFIIIHEAAILNILITIRRVWICECVSVRFVFLQCHLNRAEWAASTNFLTLLIFLSERIQPIEILRNEAQNFDDLFVSETLDKIFNTLVLTHAYLDTIWVHRSWAIFVQTAPHSIRFSTWRVCSHMRSICHGSNNLHLPF